MAQATATASGIVLAVLLCSNVEFCHGSKQEPLLEEFHIVAGLVQPFNLATAVVVAQVFVEWLLHIVKIWLPFLNRICLQTNAVHFSAYDQLVPESQSSHSSDKVQSLDWRLLSGTYCQSGEAKQGISKRILVNPKALLLTYNFFFHVSFIPKGPGLLLTCSSSALGRQHVRL